MVRLASASPTRAQLLEEAGIAYVQSPVDVNEEALLERFSDPKEFVCAVAREKMAAAKERYGLSIPLVVADTVVSADGKILGKAKDLQEARELLKIQSGNRVDIHTCMIYDDGERRIEDLDTTSYLFAPFDPEALEAYLASGQWQGKAGACMVEGFCKEYIRQVVGRESTARGLQVERLKEILDGKAL
ncbi:MAG: septum formation inhibitor Maf [Nitratiruptor sp.]|nr:septum formation inhibitor Maf [Nitratiruptor sp.]NPA83731.1 septum formation inhibitor Maf [Campylobacterota bacterium]